MIAELIGGPRDGELQSFTVLPSRICHVAKPENYFESMTTNTTAVHLLTGVYEYEGIQLELGNPNYGRGFYEWQGYR